MKFKETIKIIWGTNRWYRYLSASIILLFVVKMLMAVIGGISFINIIGVISLISNLLVVLWLSSTVMIVYSFFHTENRPVAIQSLPDPISPRESAQFTGILKYFWGSNRWYVYFSVITASLLAGLFISGMLIDGASSTMARNEIRSSDFYQGISEFSSIFIPIWIIWTIKVVYYFKPEEMTSAPAPITRVARRFVLSLFAVVAILLFLFIIVMMFGASART